MFSLFLDIEGNECAILGVRRQCSEFYPVGYRVSFHIVGLGAIYISPGEIDGADHSSSYASILTLLKLTGLRICSLCEQRG